MKDIIVKEGFVIVNHSREHRQLCNLVFHQILATVYFNLTLTTLDEISGP